MNKNEPAFPQSPVITNEALEWPEDFSERLKGMTLRDYFAAKAMSALILGIKGTGVEIKGASITAAAYETADAMLKERAK